ncbi:heavy-metal-associated domain-containing protein [Sphingobacterium chuzhouense]|uniref:Heavy-metal-associated domain-containing protein n=1 Tax=Sphingobacterium chuzhouense TaxID=1742264 RepID=A0ABR7XMA9_9SPHI|nr:heavy-metal-associated domain-containing protein [Sphingobacterium chuzhouense]MBD1419992.1 heavy-metal-associated domain-containing protein [Sphingobacterium chuzhouense]
MRTLSYIITTCLVLLSTLSFAQIKNAKTETAKVNGNCGMCKRTIEKAGNVKNEAQVVWDADNQRASITYDAEKTTMDTVLKRIAQVGYDNEKYLAPDEVYANLHDCCQYDRKLKQSKVNKATDERSHHQSNQGSSHQGKHH